MCINKIKANLNKLVGFFFKKLKSKRYTAYVIAISLFVLLTLTTSSSPLDIASGLTMLTGIYIAGESYKPSIK